MDIEAFGRRLKELRNNKSQADIVKLIFEKTGLSITAQTFGRYENGKRKPDIEIIEALANTFDVSADYLLCRSDVKSVDINMKAMCEYTGLTPENIKDLHELATSEYIESYNMIETLNKVLSTDEFSSIITSLGIMAHSKRDVINLTFLDVEEIAIKHNIPSGVLINYWAKAVSKAVLKGDSFIDYLFAAKSSECRYNNIKNMEKLNTMFDKDIYDDMSDSEILEMFSKASNEASNKLDPVQLLPLSQLRKIVVEEKEEK